jgi:CPA2 family monovalent cation:H+ antiporter-2/glutathione-regulated potassium-efflux system protein KefB
VPVLARARDREHAVELVQAGVAFQIRETVESALALGEQALLTVGAEPEVADSIMEEVRRRDAERFDLEVVGGIYAGRDLIQGNMGVPAHRAG